MDASGKQPSIRLSPLVSTWAGLSLLTFASVAMGEWWHGTAGLPRVVALMIWLKAWLIARYFLEVQLTHPFIRRLVQVFIAFVPVALVLSDLFGPRIADWLTW